MNISKISLLLIVLAAINSGACGLESTMTTSSNGGSYIHSLEVGTSSSVNDALVSSNGVNSGTATISGPYSFSDSVSNAEGDTAGVSFTVGADVPRADAPHSATGTHSYGSDIASDHVSYWQVASVSSAKVIQAAVASLNANGDHTLAELRIVAPLGGGSLLNYWGVAEASNNAAFAAQGFDHATGLGYYVDNPLMGTFNVYGLMATTKAWNGLTTTNEVAATQMQTSSLGVFETMNNYASWAVSSNNYAVSLLQSGTIDGQGNALAIAYNPFTSGTYPFSMVRSTSNDGLIASPNYNSWPGMAWAGPTATLSMLETQTASDSAASSLMDVYAGNVQDTTSATGPADYKGAASTGTSHSSDAVYVTQTAL